MKKKIFISITSFLCSALIVLAIIGIIGLSSHDVKLQAATKTLIVQKTSTVTVYVTGKNVTYDKKASTLSEDIYYVEEGETVIIRAVNESRIFTNWVFSGVSVIDGYSATSNPCKVTIPTGGDDDLEIGTERRIPVGTDLGTYMYGRFDINSDEDLFAIERILSDDYDSIDDATKVAYYDKFLGGYPVYEDLTTVAEKIAFIKNEDNDFRSKIQNGYYKVTGNIALMNSDGFVGIGTDERPFNGVVCGENGSNYSKVISTVTAYETTGNEFYGLFSRLSKEAVVRNLIVQTSIGISSEINSGDGNIYVGGIAGVMEESLLVNVTATAIFGITSKISNVYAGGIAGILYGGLSALNNVKYDGSNADWSIDSLSEDSAKKIYSGYIAGYMDSSGTDITKNPNTQIKNLSTYLKDLEIITTNSTTNITNNSRSTSSSTYIGSLIGCLDVKTNSVDIENIEIINEGHNKIQSNIHYGNSYVGGLIGYVNASTTLNIGNVNFESLDSAKTDILSQSMNLSSRANVYSGGLLAFINDPDNSNVVANDDFKSGVIRNTIDGKEVITYKYIFNGNFQIKSLQNGSSSSGTTNGKAIAAGLVGKGVMNIKGAEFNNSQILLCSGGKFNVDAVQSKSAATSTNDTEHCIASLVFGLVSEASVEYAFEYIDVYATEAYVKATRQIGSKAIGDLFAAGFIGYSNGINYKGISLYINNSRIDVDSLSYESTSSNVGNNAYCGGLIGRAVGTNTNSIVDSKISGYNEKNLVETGTTVVIDSIQNSKAGGGNYKGENYVGGLIGQVYGLTTLNGLDFIGSESSIDKIISQGHQDPDSAFCGGIVGHIRVLDGDTGNSSKDYEIKNIRVINTEVSGYATTAANTTYSDPDIYVSGVVGAFYTYGSGIWIFGYYAGDVWKGEASYDNIYVANTEIKAIGNERIQTFASGVTGGITWSGTQNFNRCHVYDCDIIAEANSTIPYTTNSKDHANAGGIVAWSYDVTSTLTNCAVLDSVLNAKSINADANSAGILVFGNGGRSTAELSYCFVNSQIESSGGNRSPKSIFTSKRNGQTVTSDHCYYTPVSVADNQSGDNLEYEVRFEDYYIGNDNTTLEIFYDTSGNKLSSASHAYTSRFNSVLTNGVDSVFEVTPTDSNILAISPNGTGQDIAEIWINASGSGSTSIPYDLDMAHAAGWFKFGEMLVYNNEEVTNTDFILENKDDSYTLNYIDNDDRYIYDREEMINGIPHYYLKNVIDYDAKILSGYKDTVLTWYDGNELNNNTVVIGSDTYNILREIDIKVLDDMPHLELKFDAPNEYVYSPVINYGGGATTYNSFGRYEFDTAIYGDTSIHTFRFYPNEDFYSDGTVTLYLTFEVGKAGVENNCFKINLDPNIKELVDVETASYTPALNYAEEGVGTSSNPLILYAGSTTKFIPVFIKDNDYAQSRDNTDTNTQYVSYSLSSTTGLTMKTSGELIVNSHTADTKFALTISMKSGKGLEGSVVIYFVTTDSSFDVTMNATGADIEGINKASNSCDYHFTIQKYSGYSGNLDLLKVTIGSDEYNLLTLPNNFKIYADGVLVDSESDFKESVESYKVVIDESIIKGVVSIETSLSIVYEIKFILNNNSFYKDFDGASETVIHVKAGTTFVENFGTQSTPTEYLNELLQWVETGKKFGFIFNGFFLVENASSMNSYGDSFESIINDPNKQQMKIATSITFYGSWSFLIELIEAPGTTIKSSFPEEFMKEYTHIEDILCGCKGDGECACPDGSCTCYGGVPGECLCGDDLVSGYVKIPINCNQGYVFTIEKDEGFIGEASVRAFSATKYEGEIEINEIAVEKYHENMYLYFIPPEKITGYLVIQSSASSSELIVGENTSSVVEEVIPSDGVYTFKYLINHKKEATDQTFIYNAMKNKTLEKTFILEFFKQKYDPGKVYATYSSNTLSIDVRRGEFDSHVDGANTIHSISLNDLKELNTRITSHELAYEINTLTIYVSDEKASYIIEGSVDGINWVKINSYTTHTSNDDAAIESYTNKYITYNFNSSNGYKFFRIDNTSGTKQKVYQINVNGTSESGYINFTENPKSTFSNGYDVEDRYLKEGTTIEVYYHKYVDGINVQTIVGNYIVDSDNVSSIFLHQFTLLDGVTPAFSSTDTFNSFLGSANQAISEEYYFVITPPNGLDFSDVEGATTGKEEINYSIHSGYVYKDGEDYKYIEGQRTSGMIQNNPLDDEDVLGDLIIKETSKRENVYAVTRSRDTDLSYNAGQFEFKDVKYYDAFTINVSDGVFESHTEVINEEEVLKYFLTFTDEAGKNTLIYSDKLNFYLGSISFTAGFNLGTINVYGGFTVESEGINDVIWSNPIPVEITSQDALVYTVDLSKYDYTYFKIDNVSGKEMHIYDLKITDKVTNIDFDVLADEEVSSALPDPITNTYTFKIIDEIRGDYRHDGKVFMLAIQFQNAGDVVENIPLDEIMIKCNEIGYNANYSELAGHSIGYFNLSALISETNQTAQFEIDIPEEYKAYNVIVQLLEVSNVQKPAMGEVRAQIVIDASELK